MRLPPQTTSEAGTSDTPVANSWYIKSTPTESLPGQKPYSCSFVEFDERGDYLDFRQHQHAWNKIGELSNTNKERLYVVIYCHGWKNNSQSGDVLSFNQFLSRLSKSERIRSRNIRVHGIYVSWRGNVVKHALNKKDDAYKDTTTDFGGQPIVDSGYARWSFLHPLVFPEFFSYWSRKSAAESKVSGVPMARAVFTYAQAAKSSNPTNEVLVLGHSFGALMLEKSLGQACVGNLVSSWPWDWPKQNTGDSAVKLAKPYAADPASDYTADFLPFDCILFVNSAAPSIHSKMLSDFLWAHKTSLNRTLEKTGQVTNHTPVIISITSKADWATRVVHPIGNLFAGFNPSLWRDYTTGVLASDKPDKSHIPVPQSYFYRRTPGHNPLLVDHWIVPGSEQAKPLNEQQFLSGTARDVLDINMTAKRVKTKDDDFAFYTHAKNDKLLPWVISPNPPKSQTNWNSYCGQKPVERGDYWIIRCDKPLIKGHNDIWSPTTMELFTALYRLADRTPER